MLVRVILSSARSALEPFISEKTISFHYEKHHQGYVTQLNDIAKGPCVCVLFGAGLTHQHMICTIMGVVVQRIKTLLARPSRKSFARPRLAAKP